MIKKINLIIQMSKSLSLIKNYSKEEGFKKIKLRKILQSLEVIAKKIIQYKVKDHYQKRE